MPPTASGRPAALPLDEHPSFPADHPENRRPQRRATDPLLFYGDRGLISCERDTADPRTYVPEAPRGIAFITIGQTIAQVWSENRTLAGHAAVAGGGLCRLTAIDDDPPSLEATIALFESGIGI